jgi:hypothetical protein
MVSPRIMSCDALMIRVAGYIQLSLQDGIDASVAGSVLAVLLIILAKRRASKTGSLSKAAGSGA